MISRQVESASALYQNARACSLVLSVARTVGAALSPTIAVPLVGRAALLNAPFFIAGGLKIVYDLLLYRSFKAVRPPEEVSRWG